MRLHAVFSIVLFFFFVINLNGQIPNNSFEQWENNEPEGWSTSNIFIINITQSSDAHSGTSAVKGEVVDSGTGAIAPILISGLVGGHGFPVTQRYASLTGYYKLNVIDTTENLSVVIIMYKNGQGIGVGGSQFFASSTYTKFNAPVYYSNDNVPDSCQISIVLGNSPGQLANAGSYFILDDLEFEGIATEADDIENTQPGIFSLDQNYPNPFNPSTKIRYTIPSNVKGERAKVFLRVYDIPGNEISVLVNEEQSAGEYEVEFNAGNLSSGIYIYELQAGNNTEAKKMIILR